MLFRSQERARGRMSGAGDHASLHGVPNRGRVSNLGRRFYFLSFTTLVRSLAARFFSFSSASPFRLSPEHSRCLCLSPPTRSKQQARLDRRVDIVRASPSSHHSPSGSALSAAPSPPTLPTPPTTSCRQRARFLRRCRFGRRVFRSAKRASRSGCLPFRRYISSVIAADITASS